MIRLFTAIEIPEAISARLIGLQNGLPGARWIDRENFHITLRFIGEVAEDIATDIDRALAELTADPFDLFLSGIGQFGNKKPRAVWAGVSPSPVLSALQARQEKALQRLGLEPDHRNYTPHVTLARLRNGAAADVWRYIEANNLFETLPFTVERFVLFSSRLSQGGGPYVTEQVYPLQNRTAA